jgi:hypothetical protein
VTAPAPLVALLLLACSAGCEPESAETGSSAAQPGSDGPAATAGQTSPGSSNAAEGTLVIEGLLNGGFEWICDGTTDPPKFGAYWKGAFVYRAGDPTDLIEAGDDAAEGHRFLRLEAGHGPVLQKIVADPRWTDRARVVLSFRSRGGAGLDVTLEDGPGRRSVISLPAPEGPGWQTHELALGERFVADHGELPTPRLNLRLACRPPESTSAADPGADPGAEAGVDVDAVSAWITMADTSAADLADEIVAQARVALQRWYAPKSAGGLGLVDVDSGYTRVRAYDVVTGDSWVASRKVGLHSIHTTLLEWLEIANDAGWEDEITLWTPHLRRIVKTLVAHHFHPVTGLPRLVDMATREPDDVGVVTVGAYVEFLARAIPLLDDDELARAATERVRATADSLARLQLKHDLPATVFNNVKLDPKTGIFKGSHPNWYGHMPNKLTPSGELDVPRQFNTAWAIVKQRSFWYHLFKSPAAVMWAHSLQPRKQDLNALTRSLELYERRWDARRYDLENDTDDHYGYLMEDLLNVLRHGGEGLTRAGELITIATDHRLDRSARSSAETLWIQAIRLGTACAGDSPRAMKGLLGLYHLPAEWGLPGAGLPLYRDALQELAANDYKGRQLTNGQFTESFFRHWEMVCICYKGTYQGDCLERPLDEWDGDVGDIFGGPPMQGIGAQVWAYDVATPAERRVILARLATLRYITESTLARPHGYLYGMPVEIAQQYGLPEKYITGLSRRSTIGLGYLISWLHLLPMLLEQ